jgi:hypothetical protein
VAFILGDQRDGDFERAKQLWGEYQSYLLERKAVFPAGAYALATSDWYFGFSDHRAPHDSWLEWFKLEEIGTGERKSERHHSLRVRLFGAYHDRYIEFFYPIVYSYELGKPSGYSGHFDWRYDEFRLSEQGTLIHEIEWAGGPKYDARWLIEASDVEFREVPLDGAA